MRTMKLTEFNQRMQEFLKYTPNPQVSWTQFTSPGNNSPWFLMLISSRKFYKDCEFRPLDWVFQLGEVVIPPGAVSSDSPFFTLEEE